MEETGGVQLGPRKRLTPELRAELLEIGPGAFAEKYGYKKQGVGIIKGVFNKMVAKQTQSGLTSKVLGPSLLAEKPVQLPLAFRALIDFLPAPGTAITVEKMQTLQNYFSSSLALMYPVSGGDN